MKYMLLSVFLLIVGQLLIPWTGLFGILWIIPLMVKSFDQPWTFFHGFVWGLLVFGFHLSWLLCMLLSQGTGWNGALVWIMVWLWFSCSAGIWLRLTRYSWIISTMIFFVFLTRWSLLPCGVLEGYPLMNPLLCLAVMPELLRIVYYVGDFGGFMLIILFSWSMAWALHTQKGKYFGLSVVFLLPFIVGFGMCKQKNPTMDGMVFITPWWYGSKNPMFVGYRMVDALHKVVIKSQNFHTFVMPESTFCFDLEQYKNFISIWCDNFDRKNIIFGAHRKIGDYYRNSVFMLRDGVVVICYDKQHLMPFVERRPYFFDLLGLAQLFSSQADEGLNRDYGNDIILIEQQEYQLFLCSELFFQAKPIKQYPILLLWNDSWLYFEWTKRIALLFIDYFAMKHDVAIVHASTQGRTNIK